MVSPLKPFEAMAMAKAVIVSNTQALSEIVEHEHNGLLYEKGDQTSLALGLARLIEDPELRATLARNGRAWVLEHRTWRAAGRVVVNGYREVLLANAARRARETA